MLHLAYVWAWPSGEAQTMRDAVRKVLPRPSTPQADTLQPVTDSSAAADSPDTDSSAAADSPDTGTDTTPLCEQRSKATQPAERGEEQVLEDAAPHVQAVLRWSAAPSWSEKRACSHSNLQVLGTGFDIAVHIAMLVGHVRALSAGSG